MEELTISKGILDDILDNDTAFGDALKKVFKADVNLRPLRPVVAGLVGCELRHHMMFMYLLADPSLDTFGEDDRRNASLALANVYFFKRIGDEDLKKHLNETMGEEKTALLQPLFEKAGKGEEYLSDLQNGSDLYLSLRFNTPEWVIKVLKHFGHGKTYQVLRYNSRPAETFVRPCEGVDVPALLAENPDFVATPVPGVLSYKGKLPLRKHDLFKNGKLFEIRPAAKYLTDTYRTEDPKEAMVYLSARDHSLILELLESYGKTLGMNIGVPDLDKFPDVRRVLRNKDLKNVNFFAAEPDAMEASISKPQDLVFVVPDSTSFDMIPQSPDFLLHFKTEDMDAIYENQKKALLGASKYVEEGGTLVYLIYTISRKEGHSTVFSFLQDHPEFHLLTERQCFPNEDLKTSCYYAVLKKDSALAKAEPPLPDLTIMEASLDSASVSAEKVGG